jgi:hypothetical protein
MHMGTMTPNGTSQDEITILARILANNRDKMPPDMARYFVTLGFSKQDKARMHGLAVRNQDDALSPAEKEELLAYAKAGSLISILKSKARRVLGRKRKKQKAS